MKPIIGKTLIFTDQHFGVKNNSPLRQKIGVMAIKQMLSTIANEKISNAIFMGDYFHSRALISSDTINIAYKCMQALAKKCRVILILGNHDLFMKNSVDIHSLNMFQDIPNVEIVSHPTEISINGNSSLLIPWLSDMSPFKHAGYDMLFGHFDISSKYLMQSYIESNMVKAMPNQMLRSETQSDLNEKSNDLVGNFVELAKENGVIFAGHIHQHKEFNTKNRKFIFVGSPYQQTLGDIGNDTGFYVLDENQNYSFHAITGIPTHIQLKISSILDVGIDKYDYSVVANNIVQKIYDVDINMVDDQQITQKILDNRPYEELLPEYQVDITSQLSNGAEQNTIELIQKSKLEYIKNYIDTISQSSLDQAKIDRDKLFSVLEKYYKKVAE